MLAKFCVILELLMWEHLCMHEFRSERGRFVVFFVWARAYAGARLCVICRQKCHACHFSFTLGFPRDIWNCLPHSERLRFGLVKATREDNYVSLREKLLDKSLFFSSSKICLQWHVRRPPNPFFSPKPCRKTLANKPDNAKLTKVGRAYAFAFIRAVPTQPCVRLA